LQLRPHAEQRCQTAQCVGGWVTRRFFSDPGRFELFSRNRKIKRPAANRSQAISYAKANPGKINMASPGIGSTPHVAGELFKMMAGVDLVHVPYRGSGAALPDLLGGQVQVSFPGMVSSIEYIRTGKLRALAVTTATRSEALPDVPTVGEFVPGYEASGWYGMGAPRARLPRSSTSSIRRSTPLSPIPT